MYLRRTLRWLWVALCVGIFSLANSEPAAAVPDAPQETLTLKAIADSYISDVSPDTNFGAGDRLEVRRISPEAIINEQSLVRFDLSELPDGAVVHDAELRLFQYEAAGANFTINIARIAEDWREEGVTWTNAPESAIQRFNLETSTAREETISVDVTDLVQQWVHPPGNLPNYGLAILPGSGPDGHRIYSSREGESPALLHIEYEPSPEVYTAAYDGDETAVDVDGVCNVQSDYADVTPQYYVDSAGEAYPIYIKHTSSDLFVCIQGSVGQATNRFFAVNIDTDLTNNAGGNSLPDTDDYSLQVAMGDGVMSAWRGATDPPFQRLNGPEQFGDWEALVDRGEVQESAEFRIPLATLEGYSPHCGAPIGLGVYHQDVDENGSDYGWPDAQGPSQPNSWVQFHLQNPQCPIRICLEDGDGACSPATGAEVFRTVDGVAFSVDTEGYVEDRAEIAAGDGLWARQSMSKTARYNTYATSGDPQTVDFAAFNGDNGGEMTITVRPQQAPLVVHDLVVSTQWPLSPAEQETIGARLRRASEYLYDFTAGQMVLGDITVHQNYENWENADLWIYTSNNLRPKATAGGVVAEPLADPGATDLTYYPGQIHMGSHWNRYHQPPGEPIIVDGEVIDPGLFQDDWAIVFTHEIGHYLLFLFDTYFTIGPKNTVEDVYSCVGSAMGWVYDEENWGFIFDEGFWNANCGTTHAHQLLGRDEWTTIRQHYNALQTPATGPTPGLDAPPVGLTNVQFIAPSGAPTLLNDQVFDLVYQNNQTASRKAQAYLIRGDRVFPQGNPPEGDTQVELTGAAAGDRFCVYDIDDAPPATDTPRHQYGCEALSSGDNELLMERDTSWAPVVLVDPVSANSLAVSVTQPITGSPLRIRLFPEHRDASFTQTLSTTGDMATTQFDLPEVTYSAFLQVFVDEADSETNPRREAMAMFGTEGGTVPGPSSWNAKAPVYSSDGEAIAWPPQAVPLGPDQWVSMQYMVETYPSPNRVSRLSDAYRVISWPPDLAQKVVTNIRAPSLPAVAQAAGAGNAPDAGAVEESLAIRYWNGSNWVAVGTHISEGADGRYVASASVPKGVVFALFQGPVDHYLPLVTR